MFKIEVRKLMSPVKLFINFKSSESRSQQKDEQAQNAQKASKDLKIFYSQTNPKPEESNCDGMVLGKSCLTIEAGGDERHFTREYIFMKFETIGGCQANLKLTFPKQDLFDLKLKKA